MDVSQFKESADIVAVIGSYIPLKKRGAEFVGLCPFHDDKNPSLYVVPGKRIYHCFACDEGGDVIDFVQKIEGIDFKSATTKLGAARQWEPKAPIAHERTEPQPERITSKPPPNAPAPNMAMRQLGAPTRVFKILDLDGSLIAYECRYDPPEGKKEIRVWSWGARGDIPPGWGPGHLNVPRPLYGLDRLGANPSAAVLITEGPKKADAGAKLLPKYASLSWTGGAKAWHKHAWPPVAGRAVLIIPDNDEPGISAAHSLAKLLSDPRGTLGCKVRVVDPTGQPQGWDIADWTGTTDELIAWAKPRAKDFIYPESPPPEPAPSPAEASPPIEVYAQELPKRKRPQLAAVDGNTVRAPATDAQPAPALLSHDALADAFVDAHGQDWRYVGPWGKWLEWGGDAWCEDTTEKTVGLAKQITRQALYWPESAQLTFNGKRELNSIGTAKALLSFARADRQISAIVEQWDTDPMLLGVPGGVIDLRDGSMCDPSREQYITKRCAVAPQAGCPELWLKYLNRTHDGNVDIIGYLQRYAGYCATGETKEHALAFLYGTGRNGKGVFLETVSRILGDYARTSSMDTFMEQAHANHSTELARLHGARLVITEEAASGGRWNEARIKHLTGGGKITARYMRHDDFEFTPTFKLLIAANHKPMLRSVDEAIKSRIHLVPFKLTIPPEERDKDLLQKLEAEWPQILAWILEGCAEWQARGLQVPQEIHDATEQYVESEDVLGQWLEECCERKGRMESAIGYKNHAAWCEKQGERVPSRRAWSNTMVERGFEPCKGTGGARMLEGVALKLSETAQQGYDPGE